MIAVRSRTQALASNTSGALRAAQLATGYQLLLGVVAGLRGSELEHEKVERLTDGFPN
jgi:hypothetical protein